MFAKFVTKFKCKKILGKSWLIIFSTILFSSRIKNNNNIFLGGRAKSTATTATLKTFF